MRRVLESTAALAIVAPSVRANDHGHANADIIQEQTDAWTPQFFDSSQNETLVALSERIIPGSAEAQCNRLIDAVAAIESEKNKTDLLSALAAFDRKGQQRFGKPFAGLSAAQQDEIISGASREHASLHAEFGLIKEWTSDAYWSSQKGLRELGWTGRLAWDSFPDCGNPRPHN